MRDDVAFSPVSNEPFQSDPSANVVTWSLAGGSEAKMIVHAAGKDTGLACTIAEHIWQAGDAGGFHIHLLEDEAFYILEGEVTVRMPDDDKTYVARAGELIWHPRGRRHDYAVSVDSPARVLQILIPGTNLVPHFFEAIASGRAENIDKPEAATEFFRWSRETFGVEFSAPEDG